MLQRNDLRSRTALLACNTKNGLGETKPKPKPSRPRSLHLAVSLSVFGVGALLFAYGLRARFEAPTLSIPIPDNLALVAHTLRPEILERVEAVRQNPSDPAKRGALGALYEAHGLERLALRCYAAAIDADPADPRWQYHWAVLASQLGDYPGAERAFRAVIENRPEHGPAFERYGLLLVDRNAMTEAADAFKRVIELHPNRPQGYVRMARLSITAGRMDDAIVWLNQALGCAPDSREAHYLLGVVHRTLGDRDSAAISLARGRGTERVLLPDPWRGDVRDIRLTPTARYEYAAQLRAAGRVTEAIDVLERLLSDDPDNVEVMNRLSLAYLSLQRANAAQQILERALTVREDYFPAHLNLALALDAQGDLTGALASATRATMLAPLMGQTHRTRASILVRMKRYEEARRSFRQAVARLPTDSDLYVGIGEMSIMLREWDQTLEAFEKAVELSPQSIKALYNLAFVRTSLGRYDWAVDALRRAMVLEPDNERVHAALVAAEARLQQD